MDDHTRQRLLLGLVIVLGLSTSVLFLNNRDLRDEVALLRINPDELQRRVDQRAGRLVVDAVRGRRHDMIAAGQWLHSFYQSDQGLKRPDGLWIDKHPDFEGIGVWLFDVYLASRLAGDDDIQARKRVVDGIEQSDEWREKHPERRAPR